MRKTKEAFVWIVNLLKGKKIPFQISGGFAARIYGSKRPLADIDVEVRSNDLFKIQKLVQKYIIYGPKKYKDNSFDLLLMTLDYKGQKIDISGLDSQKLFNKKTRKWEKEKTCRLKTINKKVFGLIVPIVTIKELIDYKKKIARDVDIEDVKAISKNMIKTQFL